MARASWKGITPKMLGEAWQRSGRSSRHKARLEFREQAELIMEISIEQAPYDDGELEAAHHIEVRQGNQHNMGVSIQVGGMVGDVNVDAYAWEQHERNGLSWQRGPGTLAKQEGTTRYVGGKYLERALDEREDELTEAVFEALVGEFF